MFVYFLLLYSDFVQRSCNVANLLGVYILGVPIEELMFDASVGQSGPSPMSTCTGIAFHQGDLSDLCGSKRLGMESWLATDDCALGSSHHADGRGGLFPGN